MHGLKQKHQARKSDVLALNIDIASKIFDLTGIAAPQDMNVMRLMPYLENKTYQAAQTFSWNILI